MLRMRTELESEKGGEVSSDVHRESCCGNGAGNLSIARDPDVVKDHEFIVGHVFS